MVRNYKRKTNKGAYDKYQLREAVSAVRHGILSGYKAAKLYNIPRMTIMDHVHNKRKSNYIGRRTILSPEVERNLASCLHTMEKYGFGLTRAEVLEMVGEYINLNNISSSFKNGVPGKDWFVSFSKRHQLSIKKPQAVEYARKTAIDPFIVYPYLDLLQNTIKKLGLENKPHAIWNLDETSFSKDPTKTKVVGLKGYAATRVIASTGRDNTTVLLAVNAAGQKAPPLIIFKGKNVWDEWTSPDAYPDTAYAATKNGWMESEVFERNFNKTFLPTIGEERPVLLIYDGHSTHVGLNIIEAAIAANVTIIKIPAHTSHVLQPLDVSVMKPYKDQWDKKLVQWQRLNVGNALAKKDFSKLIGSIWTEMDPQILRNGFRKTGIFPYDLNEIDHRIFDPLQLKRWQQSISNQPNQEKNEPQTLLIMSLNCLNNIFCNLGNTCNDIRSNESAAVLAKEVNITFEELLLNKVKRSDNCSKVKRQKVATGAEVITHEDVVKFKKDKINESNTKAKKRSNPVLKKTGDVVQLNELSRMNSQLLPFAASNSQDLPDCLQENEVVNPNVKITSNILLKKASIPNKDHSEPGPSGLQKTTIVNHKATSIKISTKKIPSTTIYKGTQNIKILGKENKSPNLKKTSVSLSSSTTSVSEVCSIHSDSDIDNIISDYDYNNTDYSDMPYENEIKVPEVKNIKAEISKEPEINSLRLNLGNKYIDEDYEVRNMPNNLYSINDHVLVRYYKRNNWTYYVGIIENVSILNEEYYYSIKFYKTIKKPTLLFKMTKKLDRDDVPAISIVKNIDLSKNEQIPNSFILTCEADELYFS